MADDKKFTEDAYEQTLIALFRDELGYAYECGYEVERDYKEPFYRADLVASMRRLNPELPADAMDEGIKQITNISIGTLEQNNEQFTLRMQNGAELGFLQNGEERTALMRLIDFDHPERNLFKVVNQWRVEEYKNKRCDMVVMVNGLPLVVVELKSAISEDATIDDAYKQIKNYQQSVPSLFSYNAFNVISDMSETRAGTITAKLERYMEWKTVDGSYESTLFADYRTFFLGMFQKAATARHPAELHLLRQEPGQIRQDSYRLPSVLRRGQSPCSAPVPQWKATEKSVCSAHAGFGQEPLHGVLRPPAGATVARSNHRGGNRPQGPRQPALRSVLPLPGLPSSGTTERPSREDLGNLLRNRKSGGIIFTTIQKFEEGDSALSTRRNIIVMTDEAHRSQYGEEHWDNKSLTMKKGFSRKMREALPGASFIGFTGTPISDRDRDTEEVFGNYIDVYDMSQAVDDGATRPVYYESRVVNLNLDEDTMKLLNDEFDNLADEGATEEQIRQAKQEHSRLEVLLGEDATIDTLVRDIIQHYEQNRAQELTGKAMIVALTRSIAIKIYRKMLELRPEWTEKVKVVMSGSNQDPEDWQPIIGNEAYKKELARKFKDNDDEMKIAIVRDMWLTGFDVPSLATMYVYKPMSGHNLMQAIARVNRVFPGKEGGLIVDYVGIAQALKSAMQQYTNRDRRRFGDPDIAKTALVKWKEEMEICRDQLHGFDYSGFFEQDNSKRALAITSGANFLSSPAMVQRKKNFMEHSNLLHNATTLCRSLLNEQQKAEVCYMDALRVMILKLSQKGKISRHEINERIGELLRQSVKTDGVINLFGDRRIEFSLFDDAFIQEVKNMKERNLAVELLTKLMKEKIKQQQKTNVVQSDLFSDMLSRVSPTI